MTWRIELAGPTDIAGFRHAVRALVAERIAPDAVHLTVAGAARIGLFDEPLLSLPEQPPPLTLPAGFATLCDTVVMHDDDDRFDRLYQLAWRLAHDRGAWADTLDPERRTLEQMARTVRREIHKMHAFVRFRPVRCEATGSPDEPADAIEHVAWFEPAHHVLVPVADFFSRRFAHQRWALLTPRGSVRRRDGALHWGPPASADDAPAADAGEALWLAYYRSIFNPARLKVAMMKREMPVRYWPHLPEARQIPTLIAQAAARTDTMLVAEPAPRLRRKAQSGGCTPGLPQTSSPIIDLAALRRLAEHCTDCPLAAHATQLVWGEGAAGAALMLVGEQPGDREDLEGRPFVGPAGQLLRDAIAALSWPAEQLYLTNAVKHFHFTWRGKRRLHKTPGQREVDACHQWLDHEISRVQPHALVALGVTAAQSLLGRPVSMQHEAGQWCDERADGRPVLIVPHPASLLRAAGGLDDAALAQWRALLAQASPVLSPSPESPGSR